jgi:hypothetical protein
LIFRHNSVLDQQLLKLIYPFQKRKENINLYAHPATANGDVILRESESTYH